MAYRHPRCQVIPLPDHQVSVQIEGSERLRWHHGPSYPRPFFYPLMGPARVPLTRMGHPGAPNHDHHRSIWFAHHKVLGIDFWSDSTAARIRQKSWLAYQDGDSEALLGFLLGWYDGHDPAELLEQELLVSVAPAPEGETLVELQSTFRPRAESLELGKTNFGFLAVRVAKSISAAFGGGQLTGSDGQKGEPALFGKRHAWMDYSGPVEGERVEGITYFDHPDNPGHPTHWHVREDGWMGASVCFAEPRTLTREKPLRLRYLLHAHQGDVASGRANAILKTFASRPALEVVRGQIKHHQYTIQRAGR